MQNWQSNSLLLHLPKNVASTSEHHDSQQNSTLATPAHVQRIEKALQIGPLISFIEKLKAHNLKKNEEEKIISQSCQSDHCSNFHTNRRKEMKLNVHLHSSKMWIMDVLSGDTCSDNDDDVSNKHSPESSCARIKRLLKEHSYHKKFQERCRRHSLQTRKKFMHYSSNFVTAGHGQKDVHFSLDKHNTQGTSSKIKTSHDDARIINDLGDRRLELMKHPQLSEFVKQESSSDDDDDEYLSSMTSTVDHQGQQHMHVTSSKHNSLNSDSNNNYPITSSANNSTGSKSNFKKPFSNEAMMAKRKKMWMLIAKKEIPKFQKHKAIIRKDNLAQLKKLSKECQKESRKLALAAQKLSRDAASRIKRLGKEMLAYWKRFEKVEKEHRKKAEKEALEQKKVDMEMLEIKRQQRKLNFLITQTELYAHFMAKKLSNQTLNGVNAGDVAGVAHDVVHYEDILKNFDEDDSTNKLVPINGGFVRRSTDDDYDSEVMKRMACKNVKTAIDDQISKKKEFDNGLRNKMEFKNSDDAYSDPSSMNHEWNQPEIFRGRLKSYQLKGMNWLANLYDQGINGILADEMGLGKTVQSIAFLAHLSESHGIWGPFLIIAPASTLHNWQQEVTRFVPDFKVIPYWGSTQDRKVLRKFWSGSSNRKHPNYINYKESAFHVVITSYQLVVQDSKYFQQINWHYMILDEAQAIKSSNSSRWKSLLVFKCRNRLLLTGTPIQNSMAELWSLLHFIMPTLFDSHEEFNEWFSKDIESHVEKQSSLDTTQLSRLHMILKPFMLRRVKKDVENELSDKIEIKLACPLTNRQKLLYRAIKNKISIDDLLQSSSSSSLPSSGTLASNLMNIVMQLRKVCNHPELFERREVKSPLFICIPAYQMPKLMYREAYAESLSSGKDWLKKKMTIFDCLHIHRSLFNKSKDKHVGSCFSFTRFMNMSPADLTALHRMGFFARWHHYLLLLKIHSVLHYRRFICDIGTVPNASSSSSLFFIELNMATSSASLQFSPHLRNLCFTSPVNSIYAHCDNVIHFTRETPEHRKLRARNKMSARRNNLATSSYATLRDVGDNTLSGDCDIRRPIFSISELPGDDDMDEEVVDIISTDDNESQSSNNNDNSLLRSRKSYTRLLVPTFIPSFLFINVHKVLSTGSQTWYAVDRSSQYHQMRNVDACYNRQQYNILWNGLPQLISEFLNDSYPFVNTSAPGGLMGSTPQPHGYSKISIPSKETLIRDAGKLQVLDKLLTELKMNNHRVLIYSQMTRMIDLLEEFLWHRRHTYIRLDGSSKISERRDMVADFQSREDIFAFLLSTRAGGLGINLTAADTVIFYDSDWNPTVDQQAMDRAHRLGQTKQVTVYRLICEGTIEERILQRALEKSEIQRMVISGGNFAPDVLKPKEVVTLLLDDDDMDRQSRCGGMTKEGSTNSSHSSINSLQQQKRRTKGRPGRPKKIIPPNEVSVVGRSDKEGEGDNKIKSNKIKKVANISVTHAPRSTNATPQLTDDTSMMSASSFVSMPASPRSEISCTSFDIPQSESVIEEESSDSTMLVVDDPHQLPYTTLTSVNPPLKKRGRPKGSVLSRPRGRTGIQRSLCAAELAAVQAAKKATFAAHGYTYTADIPPSFLSKPTTNNNISTNHLNI